MEEIKTKVCTKCGRELPIENFYTNKSLKGGHDNTCKELAPFTPRELMLELKARGYTGDLLYQEVKITEHRINLSKLE